MSSLPRRHVRHLRDLLHGAGRAPAARLRRCAGEARVHAAGDRRSSGSTSPVYYQYGLFLKRLVIEREPRDLVHHRAGRSTTSSAGQRRVTASLVFGGAVLWLMIGLFVGILSALRPRSLFDRAGDGLRPDRRVRAPGLDRADLLLLLRLQAATLRRSRTTRTSSATRRSWTPARPGGPVAVGLPPDPAVDDVRDPVRGALRRA